MIMGIDAGIDMSMVPYNFQFADDLLALVKEGRISEARIDESVKRILYLKYELGLFENPYPPKVTVDWELQKKQCEEAAIQSLVLLRNDKNVLPLAKNKKYVVTGPAADYMPSLCGAWSYTWQGNNTDLYPAYAKTIKKSIEEAVGAVNVTYVKGCAFGELDNHATEPLGNIEQAASSADAIILVLGENSYAEALGTIEDITLPLEQRNYMKKVLALGKPVILVLAEGRPRVFSELQASFPTILLAPIPGIMGGPAIAKVLFGDANPSGKLAFSYPKNPNMMLTHDLKMSDYTINSDAAFDKPEFVSGYQPLFPFGHGLSYTTFEYSSLMTDNVTYSSSDSVSISVTVKNTGARNGMIATDVFIRDCVALLAPPYHRLRRFNKIELKAGESKTLNFKVAINELSYINAQNKETLEIGDFEVHIANLKSKFTLK
jgi:beta-glucosidase